MVYQDNPQRDSLDLSAVVEFPNLQLAATSVEFGSVLVDTADRRQLLLTNPGQVPVSYSWSWALQEAAGGQEGAHSRRCHTVLA